MKVNRKPVSGTLSQEFQYWVFGVYDAPEGVNHSWKKNYVPLHQKDIIMQLELLCY